MKRVKVYDIEDLLAILNVLHFIIHTNVLLFFFKLRVYFFRLFSFITIRTASITLFLFQISNEFFNSDFK